jgi:3-oxoacyl-[acyl-carrier-protein] synthase-3
MSAADAGAARTCADGGAAVRCADRVRGIDRRAGAYPGGNVRIQDRVYAGITGVGMAFPSRRLTNADLERMVDTSDAWIVERTGIHERRIVEPGMCGSDLGAPAALQALEMAQVEPDEVDVIIVPTVTPDTMFPATACNIQRKVGARNAWAFDLLGACSGYVYSLAVADALIRSGIHQKVLIVGVDIMSAIVNWKDRNTCVLFGDGAGATLVERLPEGKVGILDWINGADGTGAPYLYQAAGGSAKPASHATVDAMEHTIYQDGKAVFKAAVEGMASVSQQVLERIGAATEEVDLFIPHQANLRIIDYARKKLGLSPAKVVITIDRLGNTTAATIPSAMRIAHDDGRLQPGHLLLLATFGAGFTWGAAALRWTPKGS